MVEIDLKIKGKTVFEYEANSVPRVGEYLDISHDVISGSYKVTKVTHRIFQERKNKNIVNYVIVEAE